MTSDRSFLYPGAACLESLPFIAHDLQSYGEPSRMRQVLDRVKQRREPVDIKPRKLPMIVMFTDPADRHTMVEVDPEHPERTLGSDAKIIKATYQQTDDPISPMPDGWPEWLKTSRFMDLTPKGTDDLTRYVSDVDFRGKK